METDLRPDLEAARIGRRDLIRGFGVLNEKRHPPVVGLYPRKSGCDHNQQRLVEVPDIMRALDPEVGDAVWAAIAPLIPPPDRTHPLGCHRPRASDRDCFNGMLVRLATGCSWEDAERLTGHRVSDTTMRFRRDEWIAAGVFEALEEEALRAYDKIIGFDFSDVSVDGSQHKSPCGGEGTGKSPVDRGKLGWK